MNVEERAELRTLLSRPVETWPGRAGLLVRQLLDEIENEVERDTWQVASNGLVAHLVGSNHMGPLCGSPGGLLPRWRTVPGAGKCPACQSFEKRKP